MMIKRSFFGLAKPRFAYESANPAKPEKISMPKIVTLFCKTPYRGNGLLAVGEKVKTGQKVLLYGDSDAYIISSVTGTVSSVSSYIGDFGKSYTAITISASAQEETEDVFGKDPAEISLENAKKFLAFSPGAPALEGFSESDKSKIKTIVVCGVDTDLLMFTQQYVMKNRTEDISKGISILKHITGAESVVIAIPRADNSDSKPCGMKNAGAVGGASGAEIREIRSEYPAALPHMIAKEVLGNVVTAGKTWEEIGISFFSAEAVASVGQAFRSGRVPVNKVVTLIKKDMSKVLVEVRLGTPIRDIFNAFDVTLNEKDRIIIGGPLTGASVYSEDFPVQPDTDAIMVQDAESISAVSDYPCINCGECVRICPVNVPVNMLVRFCEAGKYQDAADMYDLYSCIGCGLCSFVCVAKIPIFQYIRLAKYELERMRLANLESEEAANA